MSDQTTRLQEAFGQCLTEQLATLPLKTRRLWVALSGGLDSAVLAHLCRQADLPYALGFIHINHQLQSVSSEWVEQCQALADRWSLPLICQSVNVCGDGDGLEAAARQARYQVFEHHIEEGDVLLQGHHGDDQAETVLLRILRGTGPAGLASIPSQRPLGSGYLLRPLLAWSQAEIRDYANWFGLDWIDDPSNQDLNIDRNYIRHKVVPLLEARWPKAKNQLSRLADLASEQQRVLDQWADQAAGWSEDALDQLSLAALTVLTHEQQRLMLRRWITVNKAPMPTEAQLSQIQYQAQVRQDATPCVSWGGWQMRRHKGQLYLLSSSPEVSVLTQDRIWPYPQHALTLDNGEVILWPEGLPHPGPMAKVEIRLRKGGEKIQVSAVLRKSIKKLLQDADIPVWRRSQIVLVYVDNQLWSALGIQNAFLEAAT